MRGPLTLGDASSQTVVPCRRYLCTACGVVMTVVPRGIEPRRWYARSAICLALGLWTEGKHTTLAVRRRVCSWHNPAATSWRTLRTWAAAAGTGAWAWCAGAAGLAPRAAAARAVQIAAGRAPPGTAGSTWERAYAGGATLH